MLTSTSASSMLSGVITGRLLNHDYARVKAQVDARKVDRPSLNEHPAAALPKMGNDLPNEEGLTSLRDAAPPNVPSMTDEKTDAPAARNGTTFQTAPDRVALFPIERARLRGLPVYLVVLCAALIGYGW